MKKIFKLLLCVMVIATCCFCSCNQGMEYFVYRVDSSGESLETVTTILEKRLDCLLEEGTFSVQAQSEDNTITVLLTKPSASQQENVYKALDVATTPFSATVEFLTATHYSLEDVVFDSSIIEKGKAIEVRHEMVFNYVQVTLDSAQQENVNRVFPKDVASYSGYCAVDGYVMFGVLNRGNGQMQIYCSDWEQACCFAAFFTAPLVTKLTLLSAE